MFLALSFLYKPTVLRHSAETMSTMRVAFLVAFAIDIVIGTHGAGGLLTSLIMNLPNSRKKELEGEPGLDVRYSLQ